MYILLGFVGRFLLSLIPPSGNSDHNGIQIERHFQQPAAETKAMQSYHVWCKNVFITFDLTRTG